MSYVYAGYGITFAVLAAYAGRVVWRGRALRRALTPDAGGERGPERTTP
ncbi:MAG TPA: heme exporter protein CcmD [Acidimicrobiales bacterium]